MQSSPNSTRRPIAVLVYFAYLVCCVMWVLAPLAAYVTWRARIDEAKSDWFKAGPTDFDMAIHFTGFCLIPVVFWLIGLLGAFIMRDSTAGEPLVAKHFGHQVRMGTRLLAWMPFGLVVSLLLGMVGSNFGMIGWSGAIPIILLCLLGGGVSLKGLRALVGGEAPAPPQGKSKTGSALLALFLGVIGAHKFYLGSWGWGLIFLGCAAVLLPFALLTGLVGVIDAIRLFMMSNADFDGRYNLAPEAPLKW